MINVWSVCVGTKYADDDVYILRDMVARNLRQSHRFNCLTDREIPDINCFIPEEDWPGWWAKLLLFRYATGSNLYVDLDCVIVGPLDGLISRSLSMPANWAASGHNGCQSSVMSWGIPYWSIPDAFNVDELEPPTEGGCGRYRGLWGDQELITEMYGNPGEGRIHAMQGIYSYKYHCTNGVPPDAKVVCFHGDPKPDRVSDAWVIAARSTPTAA
jgi:hypothetical protein